MGKMDDAKYRKRVRVQRKLDALGQRRKEHAARDRKLQRELEQLSREARTCEPPISQDEIARLTGASQPTISRILKGAEAE